MKSPVPPTKADKRIAEYNKLKQKLKEVEAQLIHVYHFADVYLDKAGNFGGSGVMVELTALGGKGVTPPFVIRGGLSRETIEALRGDIRRSYIEAVEFKPRGLVDDASQTKQHKDMPDNGQEVKA